jgi:hypothetical protein
MSSDRYDPPDVGLPLVESVCANGHHWAGELAWKLPMGFPEDIPFSGSVCPDCGTVLHIMAGSYERESGMGVYRRTGPPDPSVVVLIG